MEEFNTIKKEMERRLQEFADKADTYPLCNHCERTQCCGGDRDPHFHQEDGADLSAWSELLDRLEALFRKKYRLPPKD
jgi:hypothetical protein